MHLKFSNRKLIMAASGWSARGLLLLFGVAILAMKSCEATNFGVTSPSTFSINTLLTCFIRKDTPQERLRLPLSPGRPGTVWLPVDTAYVCVCLHAFVWVSMCKH